MFAVSLSRMQHAIGNKIVFGWWITCVAVIIFFSPAAAQQNDFGTWASISIKHKFSRKFSATVEEQLRMDHNAMVVAQYFTDASLEYAISKKFKFAFGYRFINNNQQTYYSKRHRLYADLSYKTKMNKLQFILRTRLQEQQKDIHSSEIGYIPDLYSRNKLTAKLDLSKKYTPYASAEMMYLLRAPNIPNNYIEKWRYCFGFEYDFNRRHGLDIFYLIQRDRMVNNPVTLYAFSFNYIFTF